MLRIAILSVLLVEGLLIVKAQQPNTNLPELYFKNDIANNCSVIEGKEDDCWNCYICDGEASNRRLSTGQVPHHFKLYDDDCQRKEFCCYSQHDSTAREMGNCGQSEPNGNPRSTRDRLRSVLQGQYPWRIWIFSGGSTEPLCAGVYIDLDKRAVITSATCIDSYSSEELLVGFTRHEGNIRIRNDFYIIHDDYDRHKQTNNIAVFGLHTEDALSPWAHPVCLPLSNPVIATSCIAVSDQDLYVNSNILGQSNCVVTVNETLDQSLLCAVSPLKNDYTPEVGGGLFCEKGTTMKNFNYVLNGIYLYKPNSLSVYTNISYYSKWIQNTVDKILK